MRARGNAPPRVHNLIRLAALANVTLQPEQEQLLSKLSLEYIEMRYPEELEVIAELNDRSAAEDHLRQTEEMILWLEARMK